VRPVAAHRGDVAALQRAFAAGAPVDARDARGRTALHVATFARQHEAIRLLARAGAKLGALENDRYDGTALIAAAHHAVVAQVRNSSAPVRRWTM